MSKEDDVAIDNAHAPSDHKSGSGGHEIATIQIPGIESGDRAAQEMVNHQAQAKKELNAELTEHAGHSDHFMPSEISGIGHGMAQMNLHENEQDRQFAKDSQFPRDNNQSASTDQQFFNKPSQSFDKDAVLAKKDVNAEIQKAAGHGFFGATDHIQPSDVAQKPGFIESIKEKAVALKDQLQPASTATLDARQLEAERLAGFSGTDDVLMKDNMLAKKDVNAEIKAAAGLGIFGATDHILPSDVASKPVARDAKHFEGEQLAGLSGLEDQNSILAKKDVNAEIQKAAGHGFFGAPDHIQPSDVAQKPGFIESIKEKAVALKDQLQPASTATLDARQLEAERLAGFSGVDDALMKENMLAKKDVNAEIKAAAGFGVFGATDHINPSAVSKGYPHREDKHFEGEQLAGLSGNADVQSVLMKKDVNAEIAKAGQGFFGPKDHIMPSEVSAGYPHREAKHFEGEELAGLSGLEDSQSLLAKKDVNAEIKKAAGHGFFGPTDHIQPSAVAPKHVPKHVDGEQLAGLSGLEDSQSILAKKDVNAEIKKVAGPGIFGAPDHIMPSDVNKPGLGETIQEKATQAASVLKDQASNVALAVKDQAMAVKDQAMAMKEQYMPSAATIDARNLEAQRLAGFTADDALMKENVLAKKDVNAEIKQVAGTGLFASDHIMPSDVAHNQQGFTERIKDKAASVVASIKDQLQSAPLGSNATNEKDSMLAKKEVNAEIESFGADNIHPSEIASAAAAGNLTVIHDGRSDQLKSEMDYEQAKGIATEEHQKPSMTALIKEKVASAANVAMAAASVVKDQLQAVTSRENSEQEFPTEFQKEDFQKELGVGAVKESDMNDDIMKDSILAKKEVNAEIKENAPVVGDNMLPSDISNAPAPSESAPLSMTERIKETVSHAASAVKETLNNLH